MERNWRLAALAMVCMALLLFSASCVSINAPAALAAAPAAVDPADIAFDPADIAPISAEAAYAANAALPVTAGPDGGAAPMKLTGSSALDQMRSLDCLAQAIYYEARSESEDGQRAVAQVVLNRMHHPAYPATVCGVVYQGPMRAGGGCQFTFTCDGSVSIPPRGEGWDRARRLAADALAGYVFAPVGHATHYHTLAVFPAWAPKLVKSALIGAHIFYRLPGGNGTAGAFSQAYAGGEPLPVPTQIFFPRREKAGKAALPYQLASYALPAHGAQADPAGPSSARVEVLATASLIDDSLPDSRIRPEYRNSGRIRGAALAYRPDPSRIALD
jgi:spore germination cell wall hydrolase CwlJ-like protein